MLGKAIPATTREHADEHRAGIAPRQVVTAGKELVQALLNAAAEASQKTAARGNLPPALLPDLLLGLLLRRRRLGHHRGSQRRPAEREDRVAPRDDVRRPPRDCIDGTFAQGFLHHTRAKGAHKPRPVVLAEKPYRGTPLMARGCFHASEREDRDEQCSAGR